MSLFKFSCFGSISSKTNDKTIYRWSQTDNEHNYQANARPIIVMLMKKLSPCGVASVKAFSMV